MSWLGAYIHPTTKAIEPTTGLERHATRTVQRPNRNRGVHMESIGMILITLLVFAVALVEDRMSERQ
jgi:hypothetical protein